MIAVYVSCATSGDIHVYRLEAAGVLAPVQRIAPGGRLMPMALSPDRRILYAARRSDPLQVLSLAIDPAAGTLAPLGAAPLPESMAYLATDRSGRWLLGASYGAHRVALSAIDGGVAGAARQVLPTGPHAHAIQADPANRFVYATSLGAGVITRYALDAEAGSLSDPRSFSPRPGASPRHFAFGAMGRFIYLLSELDASVDVLAVDPADGGLRTVQTIATLPPGFSGAPWASDLHLSPDGRRLVTSERRSSTLALFEVDPGSGWLRLISHARTESEPRGFAITPDGQHLIAAGQASHRIALHALGDGLPCLATLPTGREPNWVETRALDA